MFAWMFVCVSLNLVTCVFFIYLTSGDLESHNEFIKLKKILPRMIILKIVVENKFLKLFLKLECLHHNYKVLTHVCLSVELSVFEQDNSRMLCPRIMKFGHKIE